MGHVPVLPDSMVSTIEYNGVDYIVAYTQTPTSISIMIWHGEYLVGTSTVCHVDQCVDVVYQYPENDWHETNIVYNANIDVKTLAICVIEQSKI